LEKLGAKIKRNEQVEVDLFRNKKFINDGLLRFKGMTSLQSLNLGFTKVTDAGLVPLKDLTTYRPSTSGRRQLPTRGCPISKL